MPGTHISEAMRAAIGREYASATSYPIESSDIRRWALAVYWPEPPPRLFWDEDHARRTRHGGIVAPEEFNPFAWLTVGQTGPHQTSPRHDMDEVEHRVGIDGPGLHHQLNGGAEVDYGERMRPGDVIRSTTRLSDYYERPGRLGLMLFTVMTSVWVNQRDEQVKTQRQILIRY